MQSVVSIFSIFQSIKKGKIMSKKMSVLLFILIASFAAQAEEKEIEVLFTSKTLTPEAALMVSQAALESCRKSGFQVSVVIVDSGGNLQVLLQTSTLHLNNLPQSQCWCPIDQKLDELKEKIIKI